MPARKPVFALLQQEKDLAADDALAVALRCAAPRDGEAIVETLLARDRPAGLYSLVESFHQLDGPARQRVLDDGQRIFRVLREAFGSREERVRLNVLEIIRDARLYRACYLLETALLDRHPRVRELAAETLHALADALLTIDAGPAPGAAAPQTQPLAAAAPTGWEQQRLLMGDLASRREDRRQLALALAMGVTSFATHLQPRVIEAAMWLIDDVGQRFWTAITGSSSRGLRTAIGVLEDFQNPRLVPFAMEAIARSDIRPHVLRILASRSDPDFLAEWLRQGWRLVEPRLARCMTAVKELACVEDRAAALLHLPSDAERHVSRWIRLTGLPDETRTLVMKELYRRGGSELRRSAISALTECHDERSLRLLRVVGSERELECSPIARLELARRLPDHFPPGDVIPDLPTGSAPRTPRQASPAMTLEQYWNDYDDLTQEERLRLGALVIARAPRAWALLNRHLTNPDAQYRVRALRIITTLGLSTSFAEQIYPLSYDPHPEVRSTAVAALGQLPNPTSRRIVQRALIDPDQRVQANAVEAAEEGGHVAADLLLPKLASNDNRVRANAVKALLRLGVREAAETLLRMLQDPDRRQRVSALWLIEKMGLFTLASRVIAMAAADQDADVRARASTIRARLLAQPSPQTAEALP